MALVRAPTDARERVPWPEVLLQSRAISWIACADALDSCTGVQCWSVDSLGHNVDAREPAHGVLFPKVRDPQTQARIDTIPKKALGSRHRRRRPHRVVRPVVLRGRTGPIAARDSERAEGLPVLRLLSLLRLHARCEREQNRNDRSFVHCLVILNSVVVEKSPHTLDSGGPRKYRSPSTGPGGARSCPTAR